MIVGSDDKGVVPVCPECENGKHGNCIEQALYPVTDEIVDCLCDECHKIK